MVLERVVWWGPMRAKIGTLTQEVPVSEEERLRRHDAHLFRWDSLLAYCGAALRNHLGAAPPGTARGMDRCVRCIAEWRRLNGTYPLPPG